MHCINPRLYVASRAFVLAAASLGTLMGLVQLAYWLLAGAADRLDDCLVAGFALLASSCALAFGSGAGAVKRRRGQPALLLGAAVDLLLVLALLHQRVSPSARGVFSSVVSGAESFPFALPELLFPATLLVLGLAQVFALFERRAVCAAVSQSLATLAGCCALVALWGWCYGCLPGGDALARESVNLSYFLGAGLLALGFVLRRPTAGPASLFFSTGASGRMRRLLFVPLLLLPLALNCFEAVVGAGEPSNTVWPWAVDAVLVSLFSVAAVLLVGCAAERRTAAERLPVETRESRAPFPFEDLPFAVLLLDADRIEGCNRTAAHFLGVAEPARLEGRSLLDFVESSDRCSVALGIEQAFEGGEDASWRKRTFRRQDGSRAEAELSLAGLELWGRRRVRAIVRDLGAERRARDLLRRDAQILAQLQEPVACLGLDGVVTYWNEAARRLLDGRGTQGPGFPFAACVREEDRAEVERRLALAQDGIAQWIDFRSSSAATADRWLSARVVLCFDAEARPAGTLCFLRDSGLVGDSRNFADKAGAAFGSLFDNALFGVLVLSPAGDVLSANERFLCFSGYSLAEVEKRPVRSLLHPDDATLEETRRFAAFKGGEAVVFEVRYLRSDGSTLWVEESIAPGLRSPDGRPLFLCHLYDIGKRRSLEIQLLQAQKMDAVGKLAGGIAHDFGNVLTAIQGHVTLLEMNEEFPESGRESLVEIAGASKRAASLTRQLLLFSRRQAMQPKLQDLNQILAQFLKLLQRLIGENVQLRWSPGGGPLPVHADAGMIDQVLLNLAVNARDAMPAGGVLSIETGEEYLSLAPQGLSGLEPGRYAWVRFKDTGVGIPRENMERIFEPFFTTKEIGKGTGLGLSTVFGIVRQHRGTIRVESEEGRGAAFTVLLPRIEGVEDGPGADRSFELQSGDGETILLVEDDESMREIVTRILVRGRYRVLSARDSKGALAVWERECGRIDLLLTDIVLPGSVDGVHLAEELTSRSPELRVLLSSGYGASLQAALSHENRGWSFIRKPFEVAELLEKIQRVFAR